MAGKSCVGRIHVCTAGHKKMPDFPCMWKIDKSKVERMGLLLLLRRTRVVILCQSWEVASLSLAALGLL